MKLVSLQCTQCGASLPDQPAAGVYQCKYCGSRFEGPQLQPPPQRPAEPAEPAALPTPAASAPRPRSHFFTGLWSLLGSLGTALLIGFGIYRAFAPVIHLGVGELSLSPRGLWDSVGGPPVVAQIGGKEAVLGRMRLSEDQLYIVATSSESAGQRWRIGPLGTYGEGYQVTHFLVAGERVFVTDASGALRIHDLQTGAEQKRVPLRDRASSLCMAGPSSVAVGVMDRHNLAIELADLSFHDAALPAGCDSRRRSFRGGESRDSGQRIRRPSVRGFEVEDAYVEGELAVAAAIKSPGTRTPYALGFVPQTREVIWQQLLPTVEPFSVRADEHAALVGGRYLAIYGVGSTAWRLTALDAKAGTRLWDVELRPLLAVDVIDGLVVSEQFAYVTRTSSLDIYAAATGKRIGSVGNDVYK